MAAGFMIAIPRIAYSFIQQAGSNGPHWAIGRSRIRMRGTKRGVRESQEKNEENRNLRFIDILRLRYVTISPGWIGSRRPLPISRRWVRWRRSVRARRLLRLPDRNQRLAYALRGRWFRRQRRCRRY